MAYGWCKNSVMDPHSGWARGLFRKADSGNAGWRGVCRDGPSVDGDGDGCAGEGQHEGLGLGVLRRRMRRRSSGLGSGSRP